MKKKSKKQQQKTKATQDCHRQNGESWFLPVSSQSAHPALIAHVIRVERLTVYWPLPHQSPVERCTIHVPTNSGLCYVDIKPASIIPGPAKKTSLLQAFTKP